MNKKFRFHTLFFVVCLWCSEGIVYAQTQTAPPYWSINANQGTSALFNFSGFVPGTGIIDSTTNRIRLVNSEANTDVTVSTPRACKIGQGSGMTSISANKIFVVINNVEYGNNDSLSASTFTTEGGAGGNGAVVFLRFKNVANNAFGNVECNNDGALIYTF